MPRDTNSQRSSARAIHMQTPGRSVRQPSPSHSAKGLRYDRDCHISGAGKGVSQQRLLTIAEASRRLDTNPVAVILESVQAAITHRKDPFKEFLQRWNDLSAGSVQVTGTRVNGNGRYAAESTAANVSGSTTTSTSTSTSPGTSINDGVQKPGEEPAVPSSRNQESETSSSFIVTTHKSIFEFDREEWNDCATSEGTVNPFLLYDFFGALESSGSASPRRGWVPCHIALRALADPSEHENSSNDSAESSQSPADADGSDQELERLKASAGRLLGVVPAYIKSHSYGEYVFDHSWANLYAQLGENYYPKLQCAVPFSPVPGARLLVAPGEEPAEVRASMLRVLPQVAEALKVSSVHMTFNSEEEWKIASACPGWLSRMGVQFHWENDGYKTFDDFLAALKQSKRKNIRQERKSMAKQNLRIERLRGAQITPDMWNTFYSFYLDTTDRKWGSAYLTKDFFRELGATMGDRVLLVVAYDDSIDTHEPVAGALNMIGSDALFGRNWGCRFGDRYKHLHFELCYYQAIEAAIELGLQRVEAGAQGSHKIARGYLPKATYSSHYIRLPEAALLLQKFLKREARQMSTEIELLTLEASPFKEPPQDVDKQTQELWNTLKKAQEASTGSAASE